MKNLISLLTLSFLLSTHAFSVTRSINQLQQKRRFPSLLYSAPTSPKSEAEKLTTKHEDDNNDDDDDMVQMKRDIEKMRLEAMDRIQVLSTKMKDFDTKFTTTSSKSSSSGNSVRNEKPTMKQNKVRQEIKLDEGALTEELIKKRIEKETPATVQMQQQYHPAHKDDLELLDDTHWKIALNIGREPGTWMPKTWGISGERLLINLEVCFTKDRLYEREDFLGSDENARICHVIDQQCMVGPTMSEGSRTFVVKDGGYRICKNDGPLGTDLLRFYVDVQEVIQHTGSDVYCPKGRVYCTCGFFPENRGTLANKKLHIRRELQDLELEIQNLQEAIDKTTNWMKKMSLMKQLFQLTNLKKTDLDRQLLNAQVTEPDTALLRFSRKKDVALTKEGGVCCKVKKEAGRYEYHILGKFGVGAVDAREGHE